MPAFRAPQIDLATLLAQDNPSIDLKVQNYETSTRNFLKAVTDYKNRAITTISERRTTQETEKKRIAEKTRNVEFETEACKVKEIQLMAGA
jgi:kinetochore protein Spc25, fungi type